MKPGFEESENMVQPWTFNSKGLFEMHMPMMTP